MTSQHGQPQMGPSVRWVKDHHADPAHTMSVDDNFDLHFIFGSSDDQLRQTQLKNILGASALAPLPQRATLRTRRMLPQASLPALSEGRGAALDREPGGCGMPPLSLPGSPVGGTKGVSSSSLAAHRRAPEPRTQSEPTASPSAARTTFPSLRHVPPAALPSALHTPTDASSWSQAYARRT
ncbi:hypothetical protein T484DRAFT_1752268 [Baffinella frigidus]|nr:hypothetical protein T484DRAFT_1752268 [Cryptophyta sp. CCMP2293]